MITMNVIIMKREPILNQWIKADSYILSVSVSVEFNLKPSKMCSKKDPNPDMKQYINKNRSLGSKVLNGMMAVTH